LVVAGLAGIACIGTLLARPTDIAWPRVFLPGFFAWLCADRLTAWAMVGRSPRVRLRWLRLQASAALAFGLVAVAAGYELLSGSSWRWYDWTGTLGGAFIGLFGLGVLLTARLVRRGPPHSPTDT
jgi:hypothetical protein